ncbi:RNA-directed DNA polymerase [Forsythia ovata]|uniref:RNA-directed DNA polymerase n=1 Tax=Forsythia ovata TaxID=205694 RepID=A0ABD1WMP9_9LAMI
MQVSNSLPGCPITYESLEFLESTGTVLASSNRMLCSKDKRNEGNPLIFNPSTGNLLQNLLHDNLDIDDLNNADEIADEYLLMAIKCQSDCNSTNDIKNSISRFLNVSKNARTVLFHNQNSKQGIFKCENSNSLFKSTNLVIFWKTILTVHWLLINLKLDSRKQIFKMATKAMGLTRINLMAGLTVQNRKFLCISARDSSGVEEIWSNWFAPWNFEVEHIKRNHNLLLDFLSKSQRTISAMSPIIHVLEPIDLPQHLQEEILQLTLTKRSLENVRELQKLYIHSIEWWQRNLEQAKSKYIFATVEKMGLKSQGNTTVKFIMVVNKLIKNQKPSITTEQSCASRIMYFANHVDPVNVSKELFYTDTSKWYNTDVCPKDYIKEICKCIISFVEQYSWNFEDFDHPIYRVHLRSYPKPKKYVPGLKICIDDTFDDETDDD